MKGVVGRDALARGLSGLGKDEISLGGLAFRKTEGE